MKSIISRNYLYNLLYQVIGILAPLVTAPYVSRVFGPEKLGVYTFSYSIAHYFFIFALLGLNNYGNRSVAMAKNDEDRLNCVFSEIFHMQLITAGVSCVLFLSFILVSKREYQTYYCILMLYVISSVIDINWLFFGLEEFKYTALRNTIVKLISVIATLVLIKTRDDLWIYFLIHSSSNFISCLILWPRAMKRVCFVKVSLYNVIKHLKPNATLFIPVIAVSIYKYMDKIMLGGFSTIEAGYYENSEKILTLALGAITAFGTVMMPRVSNLVATKGQHAIKETIGESIYFIIGLSIALGIGIIAIAPEFVPVFFGDEFLPCIPVLCALASTTVFTGWSNVIRTQCIIPLKKDSVYVIAEFIGAGINLLFNLIFIPVYGALGAVLGTIAAEAAVTIAQTVAVRNEIETVRYLKLSFPFVVPAVIMYAAVRWIGNMLGQTVIAIVAEVLCGAIIYITLWFVYEKQIRHRAV